MHRRRVGTHRGRRAGRHFQRCCSPLAGRVVRYPRGWRASCLSAGGQGQACRFCGFAYFLPCPTESSGEAALSVWVGVDDRGEQLGMHLMIGAIVGAVLLMACYFWLRSILTQRRAEREQQKVKDRLDQSPGQLVQEMSSRFWLPTSNQHDGDKPFIPSRPPGSAPFLTCFSC